jgi:hypothetical protein
VLRYLTIGRGSPVTIIAESAAFAAFAGLSFLASVRTLQRGIAR